MEIPPSLETKAIAHKVYKLRKSLYSLKLSPWAWFDQFTKAIKRYGHTQCQVDHTLFVKHSLGEKITILIVYVYDISITGNYDEEMCNLKKLLAKEFEVKGLSSLKYFLGMEVAHSKKGISVSLRKYVLDYLRKLE